MATTKVNSEFIAVNAISGTIIADGAITSTHLAANSVDSSELVTGSIDTIHIAANQITATKIVTNGVLTRHISDDQITADKLANSINTDIAAALPKAGGTMTGTLNGVAAAFTSYVSTTALASPDGTQILYPANNANVGIGHNNPQNNIHILGSTASPNVGITLQSDDTANAIANINLMSRLADNNNKTVEIRAYRGNLGILGDTNYGNVGIGTDTPGAKLDVSGTDVVAKFTGTNANPPQIEFIDSIGVQATIGLNTGHDFIIDTAGENVYIGADAATLGTKILTVLSTGNVGIGTPSPSDKLHVLGTGLFQDSRGGSYAGVQIHGGSVTEYPHIGVTASNPLTFKTANTERMRISSYGALHIDTASDYTGKQWLNEGDAGSPLGGTNASANTYQKLRLWVDGDINISQGRGLHFGDVTDGDPLVVREGAPSEHGVDKDRIEIWSRGQLTLTSARGRISSGDTSGAGTARSGGFYIKKTGQMGGTWEETITTPNGGDQTCRIFEDWTGRWVMVGRFAADARASIQGTWGSVSGLSTATSQSTATAFSADWGDAYPSEVRIMGCTDVEEYMDTRTIDFVYGNRPSGVHSYTPRQWKHFFAGGTVDGMTTNAGGSSRYGFTVGYAYDGKGRWYNPNMAGMGMSDNAPLVTNPIAAYSTATANAFNWNTAADAKLIATHNRTFASQDAYETTGFGADDSVQGFFDSYPTEYANMGGGTTGGGVHAAFTSAVFILLKLHW